MVLYNNIITIPKIIKCLPPTVHLSNQNVSKIGDLHLYQLEHQLTMQLLL